VATHGHAQDDGPGRGPRLVSARHGTPRARPDSPGRAQPAQTPVNQALT